VPNESEPTDTSWSQVARAPRHRKPSQPAAFLSCLARARGQRACGTPFADPTPSCSCTPTEIFLSKHVYINTALIGRDGDRYERCKCFGVPLHRSASGGQSDDIHPLCQQTQRDTLYPDAGACAVGVCVCVSESTYSCCVHKLKSIRRVFF